MWPLKKIYKKNFQEFLTYFWIHKFSSEIHRFGTVTYVHLVLCVPSLVHAIPASECFPSYPGNIPYLPEVIHSSLNETHCTMGSKQY